jgi:hypothetical protein
MTDDRECDRGDADVLDKDALPTGNSIVEAAYSAALFSAQGDKSDEQGPGDPPQADQSSQSSQ